MVTLDDAAENYSKKINAHRMCKLYSNEVSRTKIMMLQIHSVFFTCSDFDSLWCEPPVDIINKYVPLLFCQVQPIQDGGITEKKRRKLNIFIP